MNSSLLFVTLLSLLLCDNTNSRFNENQQTKSAKGIVDVYLQMKDAFAEDNSKGAASAGKKLADALTKFNEPWISEEQKKVFEDIEEDALEHASHIAENSGNIVHQREHFERLSKDIYDLVKSFGGGRELYKISDKTYNNGKGAIWISETKDIKNPYRGKKDLKKGSVQEEIK